MITLRHPGDEPAKNPETREELLEELLEAFKAPLAPTAEDLEAGYSGFATGGYTYVGHVFEPETECEVMLPEGPDVTVFEFGWRMPTDQVWDPLHALSVSQTFQMTTKSFRQFHKILGTYLLPGDKPLIHKGKKR